MTELLVRTHLFLARHRQWVVLCLALFGLGALLVAHQLRFDDDYTNMLPMSAPAIAEQVEALKHIRQADRLFFDVTTSRKDPELLGQAADMVYEALREIPELTAIRYRLEGSDALELLEELRNQLPSLLTSNDLHELQPRLELAALQSRLAWFKKALGQPQGLTLQTVLKEDPAGLGDATGLRLRTLQAGMGDASLVAGRITSSDGCHVLLSAQPGFRPSEIGRSRELMARVLPSLRSIERQFAPGTVQIALTGAHRVALDNATLIQSDSTRTSVIATIAVAALMLATYRRRWLSLLGLVPTVFGALGAIVFFYLTGEPVSAIAVGCGSILIGVTVDYGIFVLYHIDDSPPPTREQLAREVARLAPTLAFGALTTMAAFLVMLASPVSGHRQLGAFGAAGVLMAALVAVVVLPIFIPVGAVSQRRVLPLTAAMQRLFDWRDRHIQQLLPLLLLLTLLCGLGAYRLKFDGDLNRFNGMTAETRHDDQVLTQTWGKALSLTTVVVSGTNREAALIQNEQVYGLLQDLQRRGIIDSFSSIAPLTPSQSTRHTNQQSWQAFWTEERRCSLSNNLAAASIELGFRPSVFRPFLEGLTTTRAAEADTGRLKETAFDRVLGEFCGEKDDRVSICTLVKARDRASFQALREVVMREVPTARLLNKAALGDEIAGIAKRGLPVFGALVVGLNALLLYLFLGSLELAAISLFPMAAGVFWTLGVLGLCGLPIDMSNFIFVIFVLGVGGDYSLFLLTAELESVRGYEARTAATGGAVTICALTTLLGVGVLVLARHPALFSIGLTALLGISLSLVASLFLVPWCVGRLRRRIAGDLATLPNGLNSDPAACARQVRRLYRYQHPYVTQFVFWKLKLDPLFKAVAAVTPGTGQILDLGCGLGLVAHWLTLGNPARTVLGVDTDPAKLRVAKVTSRLNPRVAFENRDVLDWQYPPCDCVLMCDLLHYLPDALKGRVLRRAFTALRPGGKLILRDAFQSGARGHRVIVWSERWGLILGQNRTDHGLHFATLDQHRNWLAEIGFCNVQVQAGSGRGSNLLLTAQKSA